MNEIVGACLSQFHDDENSYELLINFSDGREVGYRIAKDAAIGVGRAFFNEFPEQVRHPD